MSGIQPASARPSAEPLEQHEEAAAIARVARRDKQAFDALYRAYYRRLKRFLEQVTRRPQLVEEVLDDTMLVVWRKADTFRGQAKPSTWIFAIAYKQAMKAMRRLQLPVQDWHAEAPSPADDPESALMRQQEMRCLRVLLGRLPSEQRAVVELTYYHGCSYKEIAGIVGCPPDTVKTRMFHARRKLRAMLTAEGLEDT